MFLDFCFKVRMVRILAESSRPFLVLVYRIVLCTFAFDTVLISQGTEFYCRNESTGHYFCPKVSTEPIDGVDRRGL